MKSIPLFGILRDLCFAAISIWIFSPFQAYFTNWYIYGILWVLWLSFACISSFELAQKVFYSKAMLIALSWHSCIALLSLFDWADFSIKQFTIPLFALSSLYYIRGGYYKSLTFLLAVFIIYLVQIELFTIPVLRETPDAARILANSDKTITNDYAGPFMANFETINSLNIFSLALVVVLITCKGRKILSILTFVLLVLSVLCLYLANYTTPLILFALVTLYLLINKGKGIKSSKVVLYLLLALFLALVVLGPLFEWLATIVGRDSSYATRFHSLSLFFSSGYIEQNRDFGIRIALYRDSIVTFFNNIFIGVGGKEYMAGGLVGGHSDILDNFAYYGLFFGLVFVLYLVSLSSIFKSVFSPKYLYYFRTIFFVFFLDCLVNTCYRDSIMYVTFFVVPSILALIQRLYVSKNTITVQNENV